ncbi:dna (cytosine-5)-methyltransferase drm1 [Quercus suber]|uniref:DNA (cytosine-5-)-methyltransferase n=1 Tax=Quercus suber TaxID=58331 RepID=A0AAW0JR78_QUESU
MLSSLVAMGYLVEEALTAMNNCVSNLNIAGSEAQLSELTDYICAAQMVKDFDAQLRESPDEEDSTSVMTSYSYTMPRNDYLPREKKRKLHKFQQFGRKCQKGKALPLTNKWWPLWDKRTKLNCLQTVIGSAKLTERIRNALENNEKYGDETPPHVQKLVLEQCRKWNLVWVGKNKVAPLEPDEIEMLLGFPRDHTRGGGISRTDRYKALGNSFQVDTVAYHLSVLKNQFPNGINLLSLFSGIGGAEVALHRLGIPLKNVVSVEIAEVNRNIIRSWWEQTNQRGQLIEIADVQQVSIERLDQWISSFGGFDLVIGGSPCNNLAGSNRVSRNGLDGKHSSMFYHYVRILDLVKTMMGRDR